ncbi:baseplate wedge subunit [Synechococcus phage S-B68]|nr:baseplate wedge subunit [Synechococcus phage S-B68]
MATVNTNHLRVRNAKNLVGTLGTNSYVFVGKPTAWIAGDEVPPTPTNSVSEYYDVHSQMLSMKLLTASDVYHAINRSLWVSGTVYDMYRHDYSITRTAYSGAANLHNANYYTVNQNNNVYVCLSNAGNGQSTVEPQNLGDEPFYTSDGYQWIRLYNLTADNVADNSTELYIPIATATDNDVVVTTAGEIYTVAIENGGADFTGNPAGVINQIPYYYCKIVGDGTGAAARVTVTNGSVSEIEVVRNGSGYTYATLDFAAGRVYQSLTDLDAENNALNPLGDGTLSTTVIIPPAGGWGTDLPTELNASRVMVFSSLAYNETDFSTNVSFRQIGILSGITGGGTTVTTTYAAKVADGSGDYTIGETISQTVTIDSVDHIAKGLVVGWDADNDVIKYLQDPKLHADTDGNLYAFSGSFAITGADSGKATLPDVAFSGVSGDMTFSVGYASPEVTKYEGEILYLTNISPVLRQGTQTEKITLVITY